MSEHPEPCDLSPGAGLLHPPDHHSKAFDLVAQDYDALQQVGRAEGTLHQDSELRQGRLHALTPDLAQSIPVHQFQGQSQIHQRKRLRGGKSAEKPPPLYCQVRIQPDHSDRV